MGVGLLFGALVVAVFATRLFDYQILTVRSDSMAPAIRSGDLIVVKPVSIDRIQPGDVVLFASGGDAIPTVHRVAGINTIELEIRGPGGEQVDVMTEHRLVTQGDANPMPDAGEVTARQLLGQVWFTIPRAGAVVGLPIQGALAGICVLALAAWVVWEVRRLVPSRM
jgi:signal peptidase I